MLPSSTLQVSSWSYSATHKIVLLSRTLQFLSTIYKLLHLSITLYIPGNVQLHIISWSGLVQFKLPLLFRQKPTWSCCCPMNFQLLLLSKRTELLNLFFISLDYKLLLLCEHTGANAPVQKSPPNPFLRTEFLLQGQLINFHYSPDHCKFLWWIICFCSRWFNSPQAHDPAPENDTLFAALQRFTSSSSGQEQ